MRGGQLSLQTPRLWETETAGKVNRCRLTIACGRRRSCSRTWGRCSSCRCRRRISGCRAPSPPSRSASRCPGPPTTCRGCRLERRGDTKGSVSVPCPHRGPWLYTTTCCKYTNFCLLSRVTKLSKLFAHYKRLMVKSLTVWGFCRINVIYIDSEQLRADGNSFAQHVLHSCMVTALETGSHT